ncbi:MAG TPA: NADH-quinone oxidoreductase subunit L, partial [Chthoniobacterales bacterium]|nr:NADH-quinone oxidoreductase subunit L [Chthoniobacterales bacterium]
VAQNFLVVPQEGDAGMIVPALAIAALLGGVGSAFFTYRNRDRELLHCDPIRRRLYFDQFYAWLIDHTQELLGRGAQLIDRYIVDGGAVRGVSGATFGIGSFLRLFQVGNVQAYAFLFGLGIVAVIYFVVFR